MHIYPKQTPSPYLLETSLPGAEKGEKNKLFASLIFQEKRQGGEQYLGLKPGLHSSPDCSLLELHRGEREKKKKKAVASLQPCAASDISQPSPPPGRKEILPAPAFKPQTLVGARLPLNPVLAGRQLCHPG